jgi:hypothetical protein
MATQCGVVCIGALDQRWVPRGTELGCDLGWSASQDVFESRYRGVGQELVDVGLHRLGQDASLFVDVSSDSHSALGVDLISALRHALRGHDAQVAELIAPYPKTNENVLNG